MTDEKQAVRQVIAQQSSFRNEKQQIIAALGGSPAELLTPSSDGRLQRKMANFSNPSSTTSLSNRIISSASNRNDVTRDLEPTPLGQREEELEQYRADEKTRMNFLRTHRWAITGALVLLVIAGVATGLAILLTRDKGGDDVTSLSSDESPCPDVDMNGIILNCENGTLPKFPPCIQEAYRDVLSVYFPMGVISAEECGASHLAVIALASAKTKGHVQDEEIYYALSMFFLGLRGMDWEQNDNWMTTADYCEWFGIGCDQTKTLVSLDLSFNNLDGSIPSEIGLLSDLGRLMLQNNFFEGSLVTQIGLLKKLKHLDLSYSQIAGSIPEALYHCTYLVKVFLQQNFLTGTISSDISNLSNLEGFLVTGLSGTIPREIGSLLSLREFGLPFSRLGGKVPTEIGLLTNLLFLHLNSNELSGNLPSELGLLTQLSAFFVDLNQFSGSLPSELGLLSNLEELMVTENQFSGTIPPALCSLPGITIDALSFSSGNAEACLNFVF